VTVIGTSAPNVMVIGDAASREDVDRVTLGTEILV